MWLYEFFKYLAECRNVLSYCKDIDIVYVFIKIIMVIQWVMLFSPHHFLRCRMVVNMRINKHYNDRKKIINYLFPCKNRVQEHMWLLVGYEVLLHVSQTMYIMIYLTLILFHAETIFYLMCFRKICVYKEIIINQIYIIWLEKWVVITQ